ncbi:MAG TPA: sugar ABC transporter substrate-binding protein [Solirubrobacteraceae bacterium]|nr:sugar ABC transporter substrate-binding protein [Solirubrobacteraceae bacterium]
MARALIVLTVLAVLLAGCGDDGGGGADGKIRFQLFGDAEELKAYRDLVRDYAKDTGREVQLVEIPDREAHLAKLLTSFAGGDPPDVFLINYRNFGGYAERSVVVPPQLEADDFYPQPVEAFTVDGRTQCVPQNVSSLVVYYNVDAFERTGLERPAKDWTHDELVRAARALTQGEQYGIGVEPGIVRASAFVWAAGGEVVDRTDDPTRFTLDTPEARRGLARLVELRRAGFSPTAKEAESRSLEERFIDGSLGMFMSSRREVPSFRTIEGFEWDVAAFPRAEENFTVLHSDAYCVAKGGNAEAAAAFVEYAAGEKGQRLLARSGRIVPSRRAIARSPEFLDPSKPPVSSQVFLDAIPRIKRLPTDASWTEAEDAADLALERLYYGDLSLDEAIERIDRETRPLLGRG